MPGQVQAAVAWGARLPGKPHTPRSVVTPPIPAASSRTGGAVAGAAPYPAVELFRHPAGAHRPQGLAAWHDPEHPVRWAWSSHGDRYGEGLELMARPDLARTQILRFTRPAKARHWLHRSPAAGGRA
jgi:hypothetical protein